MLLETDIRNMTLQQAVVLKDTLINIPLGNFCVSLKEDCPQIPSVAVKKLLPFLCTYICETTFPR